MRLTKKDSAIIGEYDYVDELDNLDPIVNKLGQLEDVLEKYDMDNIKKLSVHLELLRELTNIKNELGIDLVTLFKANKNGFYYKKDNKIEFCRWCIRVNDKLVETLPCYAVKETTLQSCYYGDVEELKPVEDAHYWSWKTCVSVSLKDYGKTWALTEEELK